MNESDFGYEYNDQGAWRLAWLIERHDARNASFAYIGEGGAIQFTDGYVPQGDGAGHYRQRG